MYVCNVGISPEDAAPARDGANAAQRRRSASFGDKRSSIFSLTFQVEFWSRPPRLILTWTFVIVIVTVMMLEEEEGKKVFQVVVLLIAKGTSGVPRLVSVSHSSLSTSCVPCFSFAFSSIYFLLPGLALFIYSFTLYSFNILFFGLLYALLQATNY